MKVNIEKKNNEKIFLILLIFLIKVVLNYFLNEIFWIVK